MNVFIKGLNKTDNRVNTNAENVGGMRKSETSKQESDKTKTTHIQTQFRIVSADNNQ